MNANMPDAAKIAALNAARVQVRALERELYDKWEALDLPADSRQWTPEQHAVNSAFARLLDPA